MIEIALLDENNKVIRIDFVENEENLNSYGKPYVLISETQGYSVPGYMYNETLKAFIQPQPYPSYILDETNFWWNPPVPYPNDGNDWYWNEDIVNWENKEVIGE